MPDLFAVTSSLHERDFYGWVEAQCAALRDHDSDRLDWHGLREELEALGRQEYRELVSRLGVLLGHLLKWQLQPQCRSRSWFCSIREQRRAIGRLFRISARRTLTTHPVAASHPAGRAR